MTKARLLQIERACRAADVPELVAEIRRLCTIIKDQREAITEMPEVLRELRRVWWVLEHHAVPKSADDRGQVSEGRELGRKRFDGARWSPGQG